MDKAIIYCRVSSDRQMRDGLGIQSQELSCREYCKRKGYDIIGIFKDEAVSGGSRDREGWNALVVECIKKKGCKVVFYDNARLARDVSIAKDFIDIIENVGCEPEFLNFDYKKSAGGKLVFNVLNATAEHMRAENREKVMERMKTHLLNGYYVFRPPKGYKRFEHTIIKDSPSFEILQHVFIKFAKGFYTNATEAWQDVNITGLKCSYSNFHQNLKSLFYTGQYDYAKWQVPLTTGSYTPMISLIEHHKILSRLNGTIIKMKKENYWLKDSCVCSKCNSNFTASYSTSRNGQKHIYYWCHKKTCSEYHKNFSETKLLTQIKHTTQLLITYLKNNRIVISERIELEYEDFIKGKVDNVELLTTQSQNIEVQIDKLVKKIMQVSNSLTINKIEKEIENLEYDKQSMLNNLEVLKNSSNHPNAKHLFTKYIEILLNLTNVLTKGSYVEKLKYMHIVFKNRFEYFEGVPTLKSVDIYREIEEFTKKVLFGGHTVKKFQRFEVVLNDYFDILSLY